jgi:hypothetical protein
MKPCISNNFGSPPTTALLGNFAIFTNDDSPRASSPVCNACNPILLSARPASSFSSFLAFRFPRFFSEPHRPVATLFAVSHSYQYANHNFFSSAMGKSRSATVVIAYLMQEHNISPSEALSHVRQARSICEPNEGFMKQLELYGEMQTPENVEDTPAYQRWVYQREIELSRACGQAPEADKIRFEDEHVTDESSGFELRCRKCR